MNGFFTGKRVLVTGHKGFIGSKISQRVSNLGGVVVGLDRCTGDVADLRVIERVFQKNSIQVVFHLAAQTEVGRSYEDPYGTYRTNVVGTLNVLECCRKYPVESAVFASSDKAYGNGQIPYVETQPLMGNADVYSMSKRMADDLCHHYADTYDLPLRVLRCANVYGPGQTNTTTLITGTILRLLKGERPVVHEGAGQTHREWLYVDDAVDAYLLTARKSVEGRFSGMFETGYYAYNIGSGQVESVAGTVMKIAGLMDANYDVPEVGQRDCNQIGSQCLDSSLFRRDFPAWHTTPLREGLEKTIAWHKEQK